MNAVGKKTAISVNVVAMTARPISSAASIAASYGDLPPRKWRMIFSISTIASSTSTPITKDSASSEIMFKLKPSSHITKNAGITDSGSATAATSVARQFRKNTKTTTTASSPPSTNISSEFS